MMITTLNLVLYILIAVLLVTVCCMLNPVLRCHFLFDTTLTECIGVSLKECVGAWRNNYKTIYTCSVTVCMALPGYWDLILRVADGSVLVLESGSGWLPQT